MTRYNVHVYREMRLRFDDIEEDTAEEAAAKARDRHFDDAADWSDCEGESLAALVDVRGDDADSQSRMIDFEAGRMLQFGERLLAALQTIAADPDACTCHTRSWYGVGHDTQCPIRIACDAVGEPSNQPIEQEAL